MSFQQHLSLLSLVIKGNHDTAADRLRDDAIQARNFLQFVSQHDLQLCVFSLLDGSPLRKVLPLDGLKQLEIFSLKQWATQERLVRELLKLSTLLAADGQEFILLKGPYLAARYFGGIDRRRFSDLDILVRRENLTAIDFVLRRAGYGRKSTVLFSTALASRFTHAFDFTKSNVTVDLHWLLSANAAHELNYEAVWRQRQSFVLHHRQFCVLSDEYEVVFSLISIFKDLERGAARFRSFIDLFFILSTVSRKLDWDLFLEHREREKIQRISVNVLALFLDYFDCRDRFPEINAAVVRKRKLITTVSPEHRRKLIESPQGGLSNKLWAAGMYECSRLHVFLWWLISLPFRLAAHGAGKYGRLKWQAMR